MQTNRIKVTKRELEVLRMLCTTSMKPKEIADTLFISKRTVDFHTANLFEKFQVNDRWALYSAATMGNYLG